MKRILATSVTCGSRCLTPGLIEIADDGSVLLAPFMAETHSTEYFAGHITIVQADLLQFISKSSNQLTLLCPSLTFQS